MTQQACYIDAGSFSEKLLWQRRQKKNIDQEVELLILKINLINFLLRVTALISTKNIFGLEKNIELYILQRYIET